VRILLDTSIIIDNLACRDEHGESLQVLDLCENGVLEGIITTVTVMDTMYTMRKHLKPAEARNAVQILLQIVGVVPVLRSDLNAALTGDSPDFEDAVQASCAARVKADYIVTRNVGAFKRSFVPAVVPGDFLRMLKSI